MMHARIVTPLIALAAMLATPAVQAAWTVDTERSVVSFVSVKNAAVAEAHTFEEVSGSASDSGTRLEIDLASVETLIPIRNKRMREFLFEISSFPQAVFETDRGPDVLRELAPGESRRVTIDGTLTLHGKSREVSAELLISRLSLGRATITTTRPILLSADAFGLSDGIEKLREIAGLNSITPMVPVSLTLVFTEQG